MIKNEGTQLMRAHRFEEAVVFYQRQIDAGGDRAVNVGGLANALLALNRYADAIEPLTEVGELEKRPLPGLMGRDAVIAICLWLTNRRVDALALMGSVIDGLNQGTITYANDLAGGMKQALQFHYMALTAADDAAIEVSTSFVRKLALATTARNWPGAVGKLVIGEGEVEAVLDEGVGVRDMDAAIMRASTDLLTRRSLVNVLFGLAIAHRASGNESECLRFMRLCAGLQNPLIEYEWHLARAEAV